MANFYNPKYNIDELISFTQNTVEVASFQQIKDSLIKTMQKLYGNDIDVSSASADGQWIMALALLYDKTFGVIKTLQQNLNVNEANGKYLDILCSYNNIFRKEASYSTCHLLIKPHNNQDYQLQPYDNVYEIRCEDINGKVWVWKEGQNLITGENTNNYIIPAKGITLEFKCDEPGEIVANMNSSFNSETPTSDTKGDICNVTIPNHTYLECWQTENAIVGQDEESDEQLRNRRTLELGNNSITVLSGLEGKLREVPSIVDVCIYNNNTGNNVELVPNYDDTGSTKYYGDNTLVEEHNVYIVLRYNKLLKPDEAEIGEIILNNMTPGVNTNFRYNGTPSFEFGEEIRKQFNISFGDSSLDQNIYWRKSYPRAVPMTLNFMVSKDFEANDEQIYREPICKLIQEYINNLTYKDTLNIANIISTINTNSKPVNGSVPYICVSGQFDVYSGNPETFIQNKGYDENKNLQHNHFGYFDYTSNLNNGENPITIQGKTNYKVTFSNFTALDGSAISYIDTGYVNAKLTITVEEVVTQNNNE